MAPTSARLPSGRLGCPSAAGPHPPALSACRGSSSSSQRRAALLHSHLCFSAGRCFCFPPVNFPRGRRRRGTAIDDMSSNVQAKKRIKRRSSEGKKNPQIPLDVTTEILVRLPARSLVRFRRVCKLWASLTSDPYFIDAHLEQARKARLLAILLGLDDCQNPTRITHIDNPSAPRRLFPRPKRVRDRLQVMGSCNGLVCIAGQVGTGIIQVVNPSTGESITLPNPTRSRYPPTNRAHAAAPAYLGFHPVTKEYKVLHFFRSTASISQSEVYTLGTSSWRPIGGIGSAADEPRHCGATANGAMYWWMPGAKVVLCFDLRDERFTRIPPPPNLAHAYRWRSYRIGGQLAELQGSICMLVFPDVMPDFFVSGEIPQMDIWMLIKHDHHTTTTTTTTTHGHEWSRKFSVMFPWRGYEPKPLLIHKEKILVYKTLSIGIKPAVNLLRYHRLKSSGEEEEEEDDEEEDDEEEEEEDDEEEEGEEKLIPRYTNYTTPFLHAESLVALPRPPP